MAVICKDCGKRFDYPLNSNCPKCGSLYNPSGAKGNSRVSFGNETTGKNSSAFDDDSNKNSTGSTSVEGYKGNKQSKKSSSQINIVKVVLILFWVISMGMGVRELISNTMPAMREPVPDIVASPTPIPVDEGEYQEPTEEFVELEIEVPQTVSNFTIKFEGYEEFGVEDIFGDIEFESFNSDDYKIISVPYSGTTLVEYDQFINDFYGGNEEVYLGYLTMINGADGINALEIQEIAYQDASVYGMAEYEMIKLQEMLAVIEYYSASVYNGLYGMEGDSYAGSFVYLVPQQFQIESFDLIELFSDSYTDSVFDITHYFMDMEY